MIIDDNYELKTMDITYRFNQTPKENSVCDKDNDWRTNAIFEVTDETDLFNNVQQAISERDSAKNCFDEELMNNQSLEAEIKLSREISEAIGEHEVMELRATLERIIKGPIETENLQKHGIFPLKLKKVIWYAAAASVILLLGVNIILLSRSYTNPELYTCRNTPYPSL